VRIVKQNKCLKHFGKNVTLVAFAFQKKGVQIYQLFKKIPTLIYSFSKPKNLLTDQPPLIDILQGNFFGTSKGFLIF